MAASCKHCGGPLMPDVGGGYIPLCAKCGQYTRNPSVEARGFSGVTIKAGDLIDAADVDASVVENIVTGGPWDPVFSAKGGPVNGMTYIVCGFAGSGKSTMLLQIAAILHRLTGRPCYYVSGEQSAQELKGTIERFNIQLGRGQLILAKSMNASGLIDDAVLAANPPSSVILDSISEICGQKNYDSQVALAKAQKEPIAVKYKCPVFMVSQMSKDGRMLGMAAMEHGPDALIEVQVIDDGRKRARILREYGLEDGDVRLASSFKNRGGPTHVDFPMLMTAEGFTAIPKKMIRERGRRTGDPLRDLILARSELEDDISGTKADLKGFREELDEINEKILKMASSKPKAEKAEKVAKSPAKPAKAPPKRERRA
jgi:predicted ATP-dependent serine protease